MQPNHRYQQSKRVTLIGAIVNALLGILKVLIGTLGNSHALVADGLHSFSDLLTDGLVIFAAKFGSREADIDHPYGHGRIETAATLALAMLLVLVGAGIIYDAGDHLFIEKSTQSPHYIVLIIALISVIANEWLFRYTLRIAEKIQSNLLKANAWHSRSDAGSSVVVLIGVGGSLLGFTYLDAIAAIIVGLFVIKMGWELGWSSLQELVDTGTDPKTLIKIEKAIHEVPGVKSMHQLRTRSMGGNILVDIHALHYLGGKIQVEVLLPLRAARDDLLTQYQTAAAELESVDEVRLVYTPPSSRGV